MREIKPGFYRCYTGSVVYVLEATELTVRFARVTPANDNEIITEPRASFAGQEEIGPVGDMVSKYERITRWHYSRHSGFTDLVAKPILEKL